MEKIAAMEAYEAASGQTGNQFASTNAATEMFALAEERHKENIVQIREEHAMAMIATKQDSKSMHDKQMARMETMMEKVAAKTAKNNVTEWAYVLFDSIFCPHSVIVTCVNRSDLFHISSM